MRFVPFLQVRFPIVVPLTGIIIHNYTRFSCVFFDIYAVLMKNYTSKIAVPIAYPNLILRVISLLLHCIKCPSTRIVFCFVTISTEII